MCVGEERVGSNGCVNVCIPVCVWGGGGEGGYGCVHFYNLLLLFDCSGMIC